MADTKQIILYSFSEKLTANNRDPSVTIEDLIAELNSTSSIKLETLWKAEVVYKGVTSTYFWNSEQSSWILSS